MQVKEYRKYKAFYSKAEGPVQKSKGFKGTKQGTNQKQRQNGAKMGF